MKNKIFFKFNLLEDEKDELYKVTQDESSKQNIKINSNNNSNNNVNTNYVKKNLE